MKKNNVIYENQSMLPHGVYGSGCYVITDGNFIKVGMTGNAKNRRNDYAKHGPNGIYRFFIKTESKKEALNLEKIIQHLFYIYGLCKYNGREWFNCYDAPGVDLILTQCKKAIKSIGYSIINVEMKNIEIK